MSAQPLAPARVRGLSALPRPSAARPTQPHRIRCRASSAREPGELETAPVAPPPREPDAALDRKEDDAEDSSDSRDQRPFIVKMIVSVATGVWSSLGRLVASIPAATAFGKLMVPLLAVACWSVRILAITDACICSVQTCAKRVTRCLHVDRRVRVRATRFARCAGDARAANQLYFSCAWHCTFAACVASACPRSRSEASQPRPCLFQHSEPDLARCRAARQRAAFPALL